jgi:hypothetical protein
MIVPVNIVAVQCNQNNSLFVTTGIDYDSDGAVVGSEITSQYTLNPGDDLTNQPTEVVNIANALWTPAVVEAYKLANPVPPPVVVAEPVVIADATSADTVTEAKPEVLVSE